ncbi:hypothetical protein N8703_03180 [Verrucomicrobia bacterium]|nr:hypothetical protein [Verrucomicrobiota bacterium]
MGWQIDQSFWFEVISLAHTLRWLDQRWGAPLNAFRKIQISPVTEMTIVVGHAQALGIHLVGPQGAAPVHLHPHWQSSF